MASKVTNKGKVSTRSGSRVAPASNRGKTVGLKVTIPPGFQFPPPVRDCASDEVTPGGPTLFIALKSAAQLYSIAAQRPGADEATRVTARVLVALVLAMASGKLDAVTKTPKTRMSVHAWARDFLRHPPIKRLDWQAWAMLTFGILMKGHDEWDCDPVSDRTDAVFECLRAIEN
jgi:hypothetical protein